MAFQLGISRTRLYNRLACLCDGRLIVAAPEGRRARYCSAIRDSPTC
ncbi:hypothetical protein ACPXCH_31070 [Streptomyces albogriseolus]